MTVTATDSATIPLTGTATFTLTVAGGLYETNTTPYRQPGIHETGLDIAGDSYDRCSLLARMHESVEKVGNAWTSEGRIAPVQ